MRIVENEKYNFAGQTLKGIKIAERKLISFFFL